MSRWWEPPEEVAALAPVQRMAFGLACVEHLWPSFELQVQTQPDILPLGSLSAVEYRQCVDALWGWVGAPCDGVPACVTEEHVAAAESDKPAEGLTFLIADAVEALWCARTAYREPDHAVHSGRHALDALDMLVHALLGPAVGSDDLDEEQRLAGEREEAVATHELVELERTAQAETLAALASGAEPAGLREPAQQTGQRIARWTAELL